MSAANPRAHPDIVDHLKMIQGVIERMARHSFWLRGISAALAAAWLAFVARVEVAEASAGYWPMLPLLMLFLLDGYYLWQERLFRRLYDRVRDCIRRQETTDFAMDTSPFRADEKYWSAVFSRTPLLFHGAIGALLLAVILLRGGAIG